MLVFAVVAAVLYFGNSWGIVPSIFASDLGPTAKARAVVPRPPTLVPTPVIQASKPTAVLMAAVMQPAPTIATAKTSTLTPTPDPPAVTAGSASPFPLLVGHVGNTGGDGVFLRKQPRLSDRWVAWPDKTPLVLLGNEADGDGQHWLQVRDPHANVGWIPAQFIIR